MKIKECFISTLLLRITYGNILTENYLRVIIQEVNENEAKWEADDEFAENFTLSSMKRLLGVKEPSPNEYGEENIEERSKHEPFRDKNPIPDSEIPKHFDARKHWPDCKSIGQIRNQGICGSCWAVAAASSFTDRLCIASEGNFTLPLSTEELMSCCSECGDGCNGGSIYESWKFFSYNGIVTGGEYGSNVGCQPYEVKPISDKTKSVSKYCTPGCEKVCTNSLYPIPFKKDHHKIRHAYVLPNDTKEIQKEIMRYGPVEAAFAVYSDFLLYKSGIYHHVVGEVEGWHAVKIIGWGIKAGTPYWLVANQWGEEWGEKGFFRILRGKDESHIESYIVAGIPII